jgi:hypothetical protein
LDVIDWNVLIDEHTQWERRNFPDSNMPDPIFGVMEELGELSHAHLKEAQSIRGTAEEHHMAAMDAIGDITIYLLGVMHHYRFCPSRTSEILSHNGRATSSDLVLLWLGKAVGSLAGSYAANWQPGECINKIVFWLRKYCELRGWDYDNIVCSTWNQVKRRDWLTNPVDGSVPQVH